MVHLIKYVSKFFVCHLEASTWCLPKQVKSRILIYRLSQKKLTFVWGAVALLNFELQLKVGGVLKSSGSQLFKTVPTFDF